MSRQPSLQPSPWSLVRRRRRAMDPNAARHLVEEDAYSSRGISYNPIVSAAEERLLFDEDKERQEQRLERSTRSISGVGDDDDDEDDDGMAWEPSRNSIQQEGNGTRQSSVDQGWRRSIESASIPQRLQHNNEGGDNGSHHHTSSSIDKRRIRAMWWRSAMINCIFIGAWYTFSTCISVYSQYHARVARSLTVARSLGHALTSGNPQTSGCSRRITTTSRIRSLSPAVTCSYSGHSQVSPCQYSHH